MDEFAKELINYLIENHPQISSVNIDVESKACGEVQLTTVKRSRHGSFSIVSGLANLKIMKTANVSFVKFYRDKLTTLADSTDRLFGTVVQAHWTYEDGSSILDFDKTRQQIRSLMIDMFPEQESESVQHTMHAIGKYVLAHVTE